MGQKLYFTGVDNTILRNLILAKKIVIGQQDLALIEADKIKIKKSEKLIEESKNNKLWS